MAKYPSFSDQAVQSAIDSAQQHYSSKSLTTANVGITADDGHVALLAECITVTIGDGKVCLNLPLGIGSVCIPVPISYDGKVAQACLSICTTWGIPTGVKVSVSIAGIEIVSKSFGKC
ncbi:hypothetical protein [Rheinheimera sp. 1928-s]|uniref:hypothetical protein n=1 Tax=Rheinheimera sp. 1928-s TaxID=3033803 RepID=UPI0026366412|nr:hypothetical protein [Rheinheimera sp. 1928-s]MDF3126936.1 hypothetical protein [Rheinheimera sp. 1928-s]